MITLGELFQIEPRLRNLAWEILDIEDDGMDPYFDPDQYWHYGFKKTLLRLVGFSAMNPKLRTTEAYDAAYHALYNLLPPYRQSRRGRGENYAHLN